MTASDSHMLIIPVSISVPKGWSTLSKETHSNMVGRMAAYADNLLECLGLPAKVAMTFEQRSSLPTDIVRITTDYGQCRVSPAGVCIVDADTWTDADDAFMGIARAIFCARELLLTEDVIEHAWKKLPSPSRVHNARLRRWLLHECVRYGFGTSFLAKALSEETLLLKSSHDARRLFEASIDGWPGTIRLWLSPSLYEQCYGDAQTASGYSGPAKGSFAETMDLLCESIFHETGIHFAIMDSVSDESIEENWFQLQINGMPLPPTKGLAFDQFLAACSVQELANCGIEASRFYNPVDGAPMALVTGSRHRETVEELNYHTCGSTDYVGLHVANAVRRNLGALYTPFKWLFYALQLKLVLPKLVNQVMNRWDSYDVVRILRYLLDEKISIRDMRSILEVLADSPEIVSIDASRFIVFALAGGELVQESLLLDGRKITPSSIGETIRRRMRGYISHKYARGSNTLTVYLVDSAVEEELSSPDFQGLLGPAAREYASKFLDAIRETVGFVPPHDEKPVILTTFFLRRRIRDLIRLEFPDLHVLSYQELFPGLDLRPIARIGIA